MIVTIRSSSSEVMSPALYVCQICDCDVHDVLVVIPLVQVDIGLLADQVGVSSAHTLDLGQSIHDLLFAIDVRIEQT